MIEEATETELQEFAAWRAFRDQFVRCGVCGSSVRRTSPWVWVRETTGDHVRVCFDCAGSSVMLLPFRFDEGVPRDD